MLVAFTRYCILSILVACAGGGKTTLLNALAGYMPTSAGTILVRGHKINKTIRRRISYVLQSDLFFENLTLRETLLVRGGGENGGGVCIKLMNNLPTSEGVTHT